jgi:hypothetical protein
MLRSSTRVNLDHQTASSLGLEAQYFNELTPPCISNAFIHARLLSLTIRKKSSSFVLLGFGTSGHILDFDILNKNNISFVYKLFGSLKMKL